MYPNFGVCTPTLGFVPQLWGLYRLGRLKVSMLTIDDLCQSVVHSGVFSLPAYLIMFLVFVCLFAFVCSCALCDPTLSSDGGEHRRGLHPGCLPFPYCVSAK